MGALCGDFADVHVGCVVGVEDVVLDVCLGGVGCGCGAGVAGGGDGYLCDF